MYETGLCHICQCLEAVLKLAVGARVMLRRNIDVKAGLVNGLAQLLQSQLALYQ